MFSFAGNPDTAATSPSIASADVISLFSDAYTDVPVNTFRTSWSAATLVDTMIGSDNIKKYQDLDFVGIEAVGANSIDASGMGFFHLDVWTDNATTFRVKLVDFGADNAFGGGDDTEHELVFASPAQNEWISYHLDLDSFVNMTSRDHISQIILSGLPTGIVDVYVDNMYFTSQSLGGVPAPSMAAPQPTDLQENVISLFCDTFTNVSVTTFRTSWSAATLEDITIGTNNVKKYSDLDFVGIETVGADLIDASSMTHFNVDIWTPNATTFRVKIVDFGADGGFQGGDDSEHELVFDAPANEEWIQYRLDLDSFVNMTGRENIAQIILSAAPAGGTIVYMDNMYFSKPESTAFISDKFIGNLNVYPNPAQNVVTVDASKLNTEIYSISVMDVQGVVIDQREINAVAPIERFDLSTYTTGIYFLNLETENGTYTEKLLIK